MGTAASYAAGSSTVHGQLAVAAPSGGWCTFLNKPAGSPLTQADADAIYARAASAIDNGAGIQFVNPLWYLIAEGSKNAIRQRLNQLAAQGATCDSLPNDLSKDPVIDQGIPDKPGEVIDPTQILNAIIDWTGLGDILVKMGVLVAILVLLLLAIRRVLT